MEFSTAVALGRTMCISVPGIQNDGFGGGCAIGMAARAIGLDKVAFFWDGQWRNRLTCPDFPILGTVARCPCVACGGMPNDDSVGRIVAHVFNNHVHGDHTWTLDQLIDWVAAREQEARGGQEAVRKVDAEEPVLA